MTDTTDTTDTTDAENVEPEPAEEPQGAGQQSEEVEDTDESESGAADVTARIAAEAKGYRKRVADLNAELATANGQITALREHVGELQANVIEGLLVDRLIDPTDFEVYVGIDAVLGEDGRIDRQKLDEHVDALLEQKPYLKAPPSSGSVRTRPKPNKGEQTEPTDRLQLTRGRQDPVDAAFGPAERPQLGDIRRPRTATVSDDGTRTWATKTGRSMTVETDGDPLK